MSALIGTDINNLWHRHGIDDLAVCLPFNGLVFPGPSLCGANSYRLSTQDQLKNLLRHLMISAGKALAALGLWAQDPGLNALSLACAHLFGALGLACLLLMTWVVLQRRLR